MATDPQTLISQANCFDCYLPQYPLMRLALLRQILLALNPSAVTDPQTLISQASCYDCYLAQYPLLELALLAQIVANGGGGGGGTTCGAGAPVAAPSTTCALYIDTNTGTLYSYYGGAWH